jgi:membrane fusion protein (multidrug efflux system)
MASHFPRSLRTLEADSPTRNIVLLVLTAIFLALWAGWFVLSQVGVYAVTDVARLEVDHENHPVGAPVGGRVVAVDLAVGRSVRAGEVLLELDATAEELERNEEQVRLAPVASQIDLLKEELAAEQRALAEERQSALAGIAESEARTRQSVAAARFAVDEAHRLATLQQSGLVSELEALRASNVATEREGDAQSSEFAARRLTRDLEVREQNRLSQIARLKRDIASVEGERGEALAASERISHDIDQRTVRAPISGTIAEVAPIRIGSMVTLGDRICTIVPDGEVKVIALFAPAMALGRVREGQVARVRLEAFPWTQYGSATARVSSVAGELHDGKIRVELALDRNERSTLPFQHGLPAEVNVEIERVSPAALVLRSIGAYTRVAAMTR